MQTLDDILQLDFFKDLIKNPKVTVIPFLKKEGPIISEENIPEIIEALMVDYLRKKIEVQIYIKDYEYKLTDFEVLEKFETEVTNGIGEQVKIMHFFTFNPELDAIHQLEKVMKDPNFYSWAVQ